MLHKLIANEDLPCKACARLLEECGVEREALKAFLDAAPDNHTTSDAVSKEPSANSPPEDAEQSEKEKVKDTMSGMEYAKSMDPIMVLLEPGSYGKKFPMRCTICRSKAAPAGRVMDLTTMKYKTVKHFVDRHTSCSKHQLALAQKKMESPGPDIAVTECQALQVNDPLTGGHLHDCRAEFELWTSMAFFQFAKHSYWQEPGEGWFVRSVTCAKEVAVDPKCKRSVCNECLKLGSSNSVVRVVLRFVEKYLAAKILHARLFLDREAVSDVEKEIADSPVFKDAKRLKQFLTMKLTHLQMLVRKQWTSTPMQCMEQNATYQDFHMMIARPCINCNVASVPEAFADVVARWTAYVASGRASDSEICNIKIANAALKGDLDEHPVLQGLALQCQRMLEKRQRNIHTMRGRRGQHTALEASLIADAGCRFAMAAGNSKLGREPLGY